MILGLLKVVAVLAIILACLFVIELYRASDNGENPFQ